ncbi:MAG: hypothetical protein KJO91_03375, partial [Gammaproteobacteria bacterium]|nr:hypothetical protein [Gammaproteobacteria bacterium]
SESVDDDAELFLANVKAEIDTMVSSFDESVAYDLRTPNFRAKHSTEKTCYVWFETNTREHLKKFYRHYNGWKPVGKPIVTARIFNVARYTKLLVDSGIPVLSGFKTSDPLRNKPFHDPQAWATIAEVAREVSALTGGKPVILENEGAVKRMLSNDITSINHEALVQSISAQDWPEIWFWYAPMGWNERVQNISKKIASAVKQAIPNSRLIEASSAGYSSSPKNKISRTNLQRTLSLENDPISIVYLDDARSNFWPLKDANQAVNTAFGSTVVVYPGILDIGNASIVSNSMDATACRNENPFPSIAKF